LTDCVCCMNCDDIDNLMICDMVSHYTNSELVSDKEAARQRMCQDDPINHQYFIMVDNLFSYSQHK
jgi:hypothetical protein